MELPRQPEPVQVKITGKHDEDIYRAFLAVKRSLENHYASIEGRVAEGGYLITCYPFAVND